MTLDLIKRRVDTARVTLTPEPRAAGHDPAAWKDFVGGPVDGRCTIVARCIHGDWPSVAVPYGFGLQAHYEYMEDADRYEYVGDVP